MDRPYIIDSQSQDIPIESHVAVALTVRGLTGGMQDEHRAARQLIADLAKVGVVLGDMREWRRNFLRGHVAGENEDHRLAGVIADQADELDAARAESARTGALLAGFPDGWTVADERKRLEYSGASTRELLAARARIAELEAEVAALRAVAHDALRLLRALPGVPASDSAVDIARRERPGLVALPAPPQGEDVSAGEREWGVQVSDGTVYIADDGEQSARDACATCEQLVSRLVTPWVPAGPQPAGETEGRDLRCRCTRAGARGDGGEA